jgi:hypothetical protein
MDEFTIGTFQNDEAEVENQDDEYFQTFENIISQHQDMEDGERN